MSEPCKDQSSIELTAQVMRMQLENFRGDARKIGTVFNTLRFEDPMLNISDVVADLCVENNIEYEDLSHKLNPNMTFEQLACFRAVMFQRIAKQPEKVFYVTCDNPDTLECMSAMTCNLDRLSFFGLTHFPPQGMAFRGDDYTYIRGIKKDKSMLRQGMSTIIQPDMECAVCLDVIMDTDAADACLNIRSVSKFRCGHVLCTKCAKDQRKCPVCRCSDVVEKPKLNY